jgi:hypothetical protein
METFSKGLDLTEQEFDIINARISDAIKENYATKTTPTNKGYWLQIVNGYKNYFTEEEINSSVEYTTKDLTTPPALYGLGVVIPDTFIWVFPDNKFVLEGFEIPLTNGAVDISYFQWQAFRDCLDNGNHDYLKRALMPLWDYVAEQVENQNFVII